MRGSRQTGDKTLPVAVLLLATLLIPGHAAAQTWSADRLAHARAGEVIFWPQRVNPDLDAQIFVQLAHPAELPIAGVRCGKDLIELGPPAWSHPEGLLHAFDLEWTLPRVRMTCDLFVQVDEATLAKASNPLVVRPRGAAPSISTQEVTWDSDSGEAILEVDGAGFDDEVTVLWVSASTFSTFERAARVEQQGKLSRVVTPFAASLRKAGTGQYLVVVLNEDHTAAVAPDFFTVSERLEPEVDSVRLVKRQGAPRLLVTGFELDRLSRCVLRVPAGDLPLTWVLAEDDDGLLLTLPPRFDAATLARADVGISGSTLYLVPASGRLSDHGAPDSPALSH